jgi:tetratricopeptide (TPR) repeat protein
MNMFRKGSTINDNNSNNAGDGNNLNNNNPPPVPVPKITTTTNSITTQPPPNNDNKLPEVTLTQLQDGTYVGGISLKCIEELISELDDDACMTDFVQDKIKPATQDKQESYLQKLAREQPSKVKPTADHFISHVWSYKTKSELMASLKYTLLDQLQTEDDNVYVWLDGLCVNQHVVGSKKASPEQLQQTFGESLKAIGSVVMVLSNWKNPSYAKRIWCVFEAYMTKKTPNVKVILAMSSAEEKSLVDVMIGNKMSPQFLQQLFSSVDVETAKAKEPVDEQAILQLIKQYGVADVNSVVLGNLKQWMVQGGEIALKSVDEDSVQAARICAARSMVHYTLGEFETALEWSQKALNIYIKVHGPEHQEVATGYDNVASNLEELGRLHEAFVANDKAIEIDTKILGPDHPSTLHGRSLKAGILQAQGKLKEALVVNDELLQSRRRVLGEDHPDTVTSMVYQGNILSDLKQYGEALPLYEQAIVISKRNLGENHPNMASFINNKALCLQEMGRPEDALLLHDQVITIRKKVYGEIHPVVAASYGNKADCLRIARRFNDALHLYDQALSIRVQVYGENHSTVALALNNKALCLKRLGRIDEAQQLGKQSIEIAERVLGSSHPTTVLYRENWDS